MAIEKKIAQKMQEKIVDAQVVVKKWLVKEADEIGISLRSTDIMVVLRENERIAIANIEPTRPSAEPAPLFEDFALLYLDLPLDNFRAGFYKLQISADSTMQGAQLLDAQGYFVAPLVYISADPFAGIAGPKSILPTQVATFETFSKTNDAYVLGGVHANGQAFVIKLQF